MEDSSKEKNFSTRYEEDGEDSDVEARLYAEIHYTNNIIGEKSNSIQDIDSNDSGNKSTREYGNNRMNNSAIPDLQSQSNLQTNSNAIAQTVSNTSTQNNENSVQTQSNSNSNSKKRQMTTESAKNESKKKRKKKQNKNEHNELNDNNRIINPYHKDVTSNQQHGIKLLSPAFLHLVFGKSKSKKKKAAKRLKAPAQTATVSVSCDTSAPANVSQENVLQKTSNSQVTQCITEASGFQDSESVIDISSESSNDSREDNSKYDNIEATDKKLTKQNYVVNNENSDDDTSDSDESIFEVPVPPKPAPPVIDLNDSENENEETSDDSDSSSSSDDESPYSNSQNIEQSMTNISEDVQEQNEYEYENIESVNIESEDIESENLILNCTEVQKGASSISDIKRMSHEISSQTTSEKQNDVETLKDSVSGENISSPVEETNSVVPRKGIRKSSRIQDRPTVSREKSFFQPMTDKMKSFYNDSWGGENFDLETLKSQMPRDSKKWAILDDDLNVSFSRRKRYFGVVCNRCQKEGHRQNQCPEPYKPPVCHMCGIRGHLENGCPEKKCLSCGKRQNSYRKTCEQCVRMVCSRCKARGHLEHFCPDLWRSYHQTINNTTPIFPRNVKTVMKPQHSLHCCNCAKKGHNSENCRKLRWSEHFPVPSQVTNYNGIEYSEENVSAGSYVTNSDSISGNVGSSSNFSDKTAQRVTVTEKLSRSPLPRSPRNQTLGIASNSSNQFSSSPRNEDGNIIFKVLSKRKNANAKLEHAVFRLKTYILNTHQQSMYNYWNGLSTFLFEFVKESPGQFVLRQNNQQVIMDMCVQRKIKKILQDIFHQYAGRNNFERSYMFLSFERRPNLVAEHLTQKFTEFQNKTLTKDVLELYEELQSLKSCESDQQQANSVRDHKLIECLKELTTALYRDSCADDSLIKLKKLNQKIQKKLKAKSSGKSSKKKLKSQPASDLIALKCFLDYLYHYNNVFVPYEPKRLERYIHEYKKRLEQYERLKNNPLLFPQGNNDNAGNKNSTTQNSSFSNTVTTENVLTSSSSSQIPNLMLINTSTIATQMQPNLSQMQPMENLMQPKVSSNTIRPLLTINTSISSNIHFSQNLSAMPQVGQFISRKNDSKYNQYNRLLKQAKNVIEEARDNTRPHVRKYVELLEKKIKNGIYIFKKDVQTLRVLISKPS